MGWFIVYFIVYSFCHSRTYRPITVLKIGVERVWKIKYWLGIGYSKNSSKTLPENTCITSEVIHRHKGLEYMCLQKRQIFHGHRIFQHFYHVTSIKSINTVFETGKYHSWPNTLPFRVGYWGANTRTSGRIQVHIPALVSINHVLLNRYQKKTIYGLHDWVYRSLNFIIQISFYHPASHCLAFLCYCKSNLDSGIHTWVFKPCL